MGQYRAHELAEAARQERLAEHGDADSRAEYSASDWLSFMVSDLGCVAEAIRAYHWSDATRAEMRRAAVELGGRVLGFIEHLDAEDGAR